MGGGEIPHNTLAREGRSGGTAQQSGAGKLVKVAVGGKLHRRGRRPTSHVNCK
jgi:hypothetical protein